MYGCGLYFNASLDGIIFICCDILFISLHISVCVVALWVTFPQLPLCFIGAFFFLPISVNCLQNLIAYRNVPFKFFLFDCVYPLYAKLSIIELKKVSLIRVCILFVGASFFRGKRLREGKN